MKHMDPMIPIVSVQRWCENKKNTSMSVGNIYIRTSLVRFISIFCIKQVSIIHKSLIVAALYMEWHQ